jgi:hypothetical protein
LWSLLGLTKVRPKFRNSQRDSVWKLQIATDSICPEEPKNGPISGGKAMIKKVTGGYRVVSEKGKNLGGPYKTKKEAEKRLQQVEFFKHKKS